MVDEYQDTNRPQYLLIRRLARSHRNLVRRRRPGPVDLQVARRRPPRTSSTSSRTFPKRTIVKLERNYRSTQVILDAASAVIARTGTARTSGSGPSARAATRIVYYRAGDDLEEAEFITRTARAALARRRRERTVAVLYRTNAQSRTIEDALMRDGIAYKIIGGVRFYERKEIKDALAYLRLVINPHDDVSLRRVINVPARGIGKGVMESLENLPNVTDDATCRCCCGPAAGLSPQLALGPTRARPRRAGVSGRAPPPRWPRFAT